MATYPSQDRISKPEGLLEETRDERGAVCPVTVETIGPVSKQERLDVLGVQLCQSVHRSQGRSWPGAARHCLGSPWISDHTDSSSLLCETLSHTESLPTTVTPSGLLSGFFSNLFFHSPFPQRKGALYPSTNLPWNIKSDQD